MRVVNKGVLGGSDPVLGDGCWSLTNGDWCDWWTGGVWKGGDGNEGGALWWAEAQSVVGMVGRVGALN